MRFEYICASKSGKIDEFSIFANVLEQDDDHVTIERFMKYGKLPAGNVRLSRREFDAYYKKIQTQ